MMWLAAHYYWLYLKCRQIHIELLMKPFINFSTHSTCVEQTNGTFKLNENKCLFSNDIGKCTHWCDNANDLMSAYVYHIRVSISESLRI